MQDSEKREEGEEKDTGYKMQDAGYMEQGRSE